MAGFEVLTPTAGATDWTSFNTQVTYQRKGFMELSINNYDTTGDPSIAAGGLIEVAGALFYFGDTETIGGSASTVNLNYIRVTASSSNITAAYTTNAPTWVASKNGYYNSSTGLLRYIGGCEIDLAGKWIYRNPEVHNYTRVSGSLRSSKRKKLAIGDWNMDSGAQAYVPHGVGALYKKINHVSIIIRDDEDTGVSPSEHCPTAVGIGGVKALDINTSDIILTRMAAGPFDTTDFNRTSFNRGWIVIDYDG